MNYESARNLEVYTDGEVTLVRDFFNGKGDFKKTRKLADEFIASCDKYARKVISVSDIQPAQKKLVDDDDVLAMQVIKALNKWDSSKATKDDDHSFQRFFLAFLRNLKTMPINAQKPLSKASKVIYKELLNISRREYPDRNPRDMVDELIEKGFLPEAVVAAYPSEHTSSFVYGHAENFLNEFYSYEEFLSDKNVDEENNNSDAVLKNSRWNSITGNSEEDFLIENQIDGLAEEKPDYLKKLDNLIQSMGNGTKAEETKEKLSFVYTSNLIKEKPAYFDDATIEAFTKRYKFINDGNKKLQEFMSVYGHLPNQKEMAEFLRCSESSLSMLVKRFEKAAKENL